MTHDQSISLGKRTITCDALESAATIATDRFSLWKTVLNDLQLARMVEVGVFAGEFASRILQECAAVSSYFMIDPWRHQSNWNKPANKSDADFLAIKQQALSVTAFAQDRRVVLEGTTTEMAHLLPNEGLDFAYIDGDHTLRGVTIDLIRIWPKLRPGAILAGDDFCPSIYQHSPQFEPTFVFPWAVHFAEAMGCPLFGLPFNQFAIIVDPQPNNGFHFYNLTQEYQSTSVRDALEKQKSENT